MGSDFLLTVRGEQHYPDREPEVIELTTEAELTGEDGVLRLRYQESELTGLKGTRTTFELHQDRVVLRREGMVVSEMEFIPDQVHTSLYNTPEGTLMITVHTLSVQDEMTLEGGTLKVSYNISIEGMGMGRIDYVLTVKPREP